MSAQEPTEATKGGSLKALGKRRQVFKPVLDNPYTQSNLWPFISPELAGQILDYLTVILGGLGNYNKLLQESKNLGLAMPSNEPGIKSQITIGFNSTVKALENQASVHRVEKSNKRRRREIDGHFIKYVFVTKFDIQPEVLTQPFPVLCFTASPSRDKRVKLIQLPKSSMSILSKVLNVENVGILGMTEKIEEASALYTLVENSVKEIQVPWLDGLFDGPETFMKPALKFLKTSAPILPKKNKKNEQKEGMEGKKGEIKKEGKEKMKGKEKTEGKEKGQKDEIKDKKSQEK